MTKINKNQIKGDLVESVTGVIFDNSDPKNPKVTNDTLDALPYVGTAANNKKSTPFTGALNDLPKGNYMVALGSTVTGAPSWVGTPRSIIVFGSVNGTDSNRVSQILVGSAGMAFRVDGGDWSRIGSGDGGGGSIDGAIPLTGSTNISGDLLFNIMDKAIGNDGNNIIFKENSIAFKSDYYNGSINADGIELYNDDGNFSVEFNGAIILRNNISSETYGVTEGLLTVNAGATRGLYGEVPTVSGKVSNVKFPVTSTQYIQNDGKTLVVSINGVYADESGNIDIEGGSNQAAQVLSSVPVNVTNLGGGTYTVSIPATPTNAVVWQNSEGEVLTMTTTYTYIPTSIDIYAYNRIDCIGLTETGNIIYKEGVQVPTGTPAAYPVPDAGVLKYSFVVFSNGSVSAENILSSQQLQELINQFEMKNLVISEDFTLSAEHTNACIIINGNVTCTIPAGLGARFKGCTFKVRSGSLTLAKDVSVTIRDYYSLTLYARESSSLTKDSVVAENYSFM